MEYIVVGVIKEKGEAVRWLIEKKLKWDKTKVCSNINVEVFKRNGLGGLIQNYFNNNVYKAIENAYPGQYSKKELRS